MRECENMKMRESENERMEDIPAPEPVAEEAAVGDTRGDGEDVDYDADGDRASTPDDEPPPARPPTVARRSPSPLLLFSPRGAIRTQEAHLRSSSVD